MKLIQVSQGEKCIEEQVSVVASDKPSESETEEKGTELEKSQCEVDSS